MKGDQFDEIIAACLRSALYHADAHITCSRVASAGVHLNHDDVPILELKINVGGCRAAGFDDIGEALRAVTWKPVEEREVLDHLARIGDYDVYFKAGLETRTNSGLPAASKSSEHHNAPRRADHTDEGASHQ